MPKVLGTNRGKTPEVWTLKHIFPLKLTARVIYSKGLVNVSCDWSRFAASISRYGGNMFEEKEGAVGAVGHGRVSDGV